MKMRAVLFLIPLLAACTATDVRVAALQRDETSGALCVLANEEVTESSGVAISRKSLGVYWTHNNSGDGPNLYAFDSSGADLGRYTLQGAQAIDWEDLASAVVDGKPYLFVGDVGDNARMRKMITIYQVPEPDIRKGKTELTDFKTFTLKYPDGFHDCEALFVTAEAEIQLVTKSQDGVSGVYSAALEEEGQTIELRKTGELKIDNTSPAARMVTAADASLDERRVVIRTYLSALFFEGSSRDWFSKTPKQIAVPLQAQSEAICFDFDRSRVITSSEGKPCPVLWTKIP